MQTIQNQQNFCSFSPNLNSNTNTSIRLMERYYRNSKTSVLLDNVGCPSGYLYVGKDSSKGQMCQKDGKTSFACDLKNGTTSKDNKKMYCTY
uniref:Uncharacterized protein n=1 Tax=viral metagenome TaxID=1070528 RepID=A0A6C0D2V0_9ZZZZ